ncbi:MAG TPA: hypothetical protein VG148_08205 [Pyrinomonadaceae bacterium]|nr:hypothetical protein [Pyrinomonadaceae bacterium]
MTTNKILPVALVAALLGGTVGALVMRPSKDANKAEVAQATKSNLTTPAEAQVAGVSQAKAGDDLLENELNAETANMSDQERAAFRDGFIEGARAAREAELAGISTAAATRSTAPSRVVYRDAPRSRRVASRQAPRRVYYDYGERKGRSFWQKHRDKLTVAMGAGGGAIIGGLIGGKKGAAIGALAGGGGSALYTYKLRKRNRRY